MKCQELFKDFLKKEQKFHTLFISCSDSRIDLHLITEPCQGNFCTRNIGNMVPLSRNHRVCSYQGCHEYAVIVLEVENIIVCGHSNCGGCAACPQFSKLPEGLTHTKKWLELAHSVRDRVLEEIPRRKAKTERMMEKVQCGATVETSCHLSLHPAKGC